YKYVSEGLRWQNYLKTAFVLFATILIVNPIFYIRPEKFAYDEDMSYVQIINTQQKAIKYLEIMVKNNQVVYGNFPIVYGSSDPRLGFATRSDIIFTTQQSPEIKYSAIMEPGTYDYSLPDSSFSELKEIRTSFAYVKIYKSVSE